MQYLVIGVVWSQPLPCHISRLLHVHITVRKVALVSHHHHRNLLSILHPLYLLPVLGDVLETLGVVDSEDYEEPLPGSHVLVPHGAVLLLASRVENIQETGLSVNNDLFSVTVLYGGVVLVHKMILDQLDCQC